MKPFLISVKDKSPKLLELFLELGDVSRNCIDGKSSVSQVKVITSLCTLLNAKSNRSIGLQLLLGLLLVARATDKNVGLHDWNKYENRIRCMYTLNNPLHFVR